MAALEFPPAPSDGDTYAGYVFNAAKNVWQWQVVDPSVESLSDTIITAPTDGDTLVYDNGDWVNFPSGKILQVVRAAGFATQSTTSTSFVDVSGHNVQITPKRTDSNILVWAVFEARPSSGSNEAFGYLQITDGSNNRVSGTADSLFGGFGLTRAAPSSINLFSPLVLMGWDTVASLAQLTYKLRFRVDSPNTIQVSNGQLFAIEVAG